MKRWTRYLIASMALVVVLMLAPAGISALTGSIVINGGAAYTNSSSVTLALLASDEEYEVVEMQFSDDGSTWGAWEPYATSKSWNLPAGDGTKVVSVRYRDQAGNESLSYSDAIILDTTPPSGSIAINGGANATNSTAVNLTLLAGDVGSGVAEMRLSNDGVTWTLWQSYAMSRLWTLPGDDGVKTVYVQYRDNVGNISSSYSDTIILDTTPPAGSIAINDGDAYTGSTSVALTLSASDSGSGVVEMRLSGNGSAWSAWEPYATSRAWTLPAGNGIKTVYVQYRDSVGNVSSSYNDTITLDTAPPTGSITINGGDATTNSTAATLTLSASDAGSGVAEMRFSDNGAAWSAWEAYATTRSWTLPGGDGAKTVYVQYQDRVGNISLFFGDVITLDTTPPTGSIAINNGDAYTGLTAVNLTLSANDAGSGVAEMRFSNDGATWSGWEPYAAAKLWTLPAGDGAKMVYAQYRDHVDNVSPFYVDTITLDTTPPTGSIVINGGDAYTGSTAVNLILSASDAGSGVAEMHFSNDGATWSAWEAYATTRAWTLPAGDGVKTVHVQFRDHMERVSSSYNDDIVLETAPPTGSITINNGDATTNSTAVTLTLPASDAGSGLVEMRLSNDGSTWAAWEPYATPRAWTLPAGDGEKTVYVQYQDAVGNVSPSTNDTILLDTTAPSGTIVIDGGATYATSTAVTLTLSASDATLGVVGMRFSDDGASWGDWEAYATTRAWTLPGGAGAADDGEKTVYVQYQDLAGNVSLAYDDTIILDRAPPEGSIAINDGDPYTQSISATLTLSATDMTSGISQMRFSEDGAAWDAWEAYATSRAWTLSEGDGVKTVYVQYEDLAGNVSAHISDTIVLDTLVPTGSIAINDGAIATNSTAVTLTLAASDEGSGVAEMRFSEDSFTWDAWAPYATDVPWTLATGAPPAGDGEKTVYVQYRDHALHVSVPYSDTIILDTVAPVSSAASPASSQLTFFTVTWSGTDAHSGIASYDVQYRAGSDGAWTPWLSGIIETSAVFGPSAPVVVIRGETYYLQVRARDHAGNLEDYPGGDGHSSTFIEESITLYLPIIMQEGSPQDQDPQPK